MGGGNRLLIKDILLPKPINKHDENLLVYEFWDLLLPYLLEEYGVLLGEDFYDEGPYELNEKVSLKKGDVVIDCGANMGFFSAIASSKNCKVFSFEPMKYIINNYLRKTSQWNKNIIICPYALSNKNENLYFSLNEENIGSSKQNCDILKEKGQDVEAITLDSFVKENELMRVDFIKADIEGAERKMLLGASNTIYKFNPKISICTYHFPDDPEVLKDIILDIQPRYKIIEKYKKIYAYIE